MGQWDDLPYEVRPQIVEELLEEEGTWQQANKQMYTMFQSFDFQSISINLQKPDKYFFSIMKSPLKPGIYVKELTINELIIPKDTVKIESAKDPLSKIIKRTPNVKKVSIVQPPPRRIIRRTPEGNEVSDVKTAKTKQWEYLSAVLLQNHMWKLHKLPDLVGEEPANISAYFNHACHVKNSLRELNLQRGTIDGWDFGLLVGFKQLTRLEVGENVLKNLYHCTTLLKYLPHLETLHVNGFQDRLDLDSTQRDDTNNNSNIRKCNHITELSPKSYNSSTDTSCYIL